MNDEYIKFLKNAGDFVFVENKPEQADIIFVPGNGYPQMAERAAELYREGFAPYILPSGKYSVTAGKFSGVLKKADCYPGEYETEWDFLKDVLIKNGVPEEAVLKENNATYTYENAVFSRRVTDVAGIEIKKAIICCKTHHMRRSLMYYQLCYPETEFIAVPVNADGITRENWRDTEEGVDAVTGEITRILKQFECMLKK